MIHKYIHHAMKFAKYEKINEEEPFYGEIEGIRRVWTTGKTIEE